MTDSGRRGGRCYSSRSPSYTKAPRRRVSHDEIGVDRERVGILKVVVVESQVRMPPDRIVTGRLPCSANGLKVNVACTVVELREPRNGAYEGSRK